MFREPAILLEDNHLLAIDKPAGMPSSPPATGMTAADWAKSFLKTRHSKRGNVYLGVVHRIDRPTTGVLLFARTGKAASRIADCWRLGRAAKTYLALVTGEPPGDAGDLADYLVTEGAVGGGVRRTRVVTQEHPEARHALLGYRVLGRHKGHSLLEVNPKTGRTHQIRVQLASRGWPIAGDERYGEARQSPWADGAIALHARSLQLPHPTRPEQVLIRAPLPREWREWAGSLADVGETA